jgi:hypothetical protein
MYLAVPSRKICSNLPSVHAVCRMVLVEEEAETKRDETKDDDSPTARLPSAGHRPVLSKAEG